MATSFSMVEGTSRNALDVSVRTALSSGNFGGKVRVDFAFLSFFCPAAGGANRTATLSAATKADAVSQRAETVRVMAGSPGGKIPLTPRPPLPQGERGSKAEDPRLRFGLRF